MAQNDEGRHRLSVRLPPELFQALSRMAAEDLISRTSLVAQLVRKEAIKRGQFGTVKTPIGSR